MSWIGSQANIFEKQKVREIASLIRDTDRHGKARIVDANEGEEPEEMLKVQVLLFCNSDSGNKMKSSEDRWVRASPVVSAGPGTSARAGREHAGGGQQSRCFQLCLPLQGQSCTFTSALYFMKCSIRTVPPPPNLLQVSDATGSMTMTKVSEKSPFAKELLVRDDCFILDNGANGKIFVWKGE